MTEVARAAALPTGALEQLFERWDIRVRWVDDDRPIPGSFWGEPEAGVANGGLWLRSDTPVHSALHEGAHLVCMGEKRRSQVTRNAGGDDAEECAVCYLSVLMSDALNGFDRQRLFADMDAWGYSFRLGSAARWFQEDAEDARRWLMDRQLTASCKRRGTEHLR